MNDRIKFTQLANFQERQKEAWFTLLKPECKYLFYGGAASGGKSYFLRWAAIGLGMYFSQKYNLENVPIGLFSADYPTLKDRQVIKMKNEIPDFLGTIKESRDEGYAFIANPEYGSFMVLLRNLDDPSKYKSAEFAAVLVEELTENPESTFDDLRFRMRYGSIPDVKFVGASNPGGVGHGFVKRKWVKPDLAEPDHEQSRFFFVPAKYDDNKYTTEEYVHQLESLPEDKRRAYKEGDWDIFAGQYFSEWRDTIHVCKPFLVNKSNVIIGGMDWGRTAPFAFLLSEVSVENIDGVKFYRSRVFLEVYGTDKTPKEWAREIKIKLKSYGLTPDDIGWIRGDPAMFTKGQDNSISIADQFKREGLKIQPASNDRIGGWENLHNWLSLAPDGLPYLQFSEMCSNSIRTIPELIHDKNRVEDVDTEGVDHAADASRYLHKHIKWIDARLGMTKHRGPIRSMPVKKRPINIDLNIFEKSVKKDRRDWTEI